MLLEGDTMNIVPMRELKDTVKIEELCKKSNEPVFVTKNGYGRLVVMDIELYEKTIKKLFEAGIVNEALASLDSGATLIGEKEAQDYINKKYGK